MAKLLSEKILTNCMMTSDIYQMVFYSEYISQNARPGQFVNVRCCEGINTILRRPISICSVNKRLNTVTLVYHLRGTGTGFLSRKKSGESIDVMGPLGNGFTLPGINDKIAVIGGGVGIFPLLFLLKESNCRGKISFLGFKNKDGCIMSEEFIKNSERVFITTDSGDLGEKGFVTDLFKEKLSEIMPDTIYTCGPEVMMKKIAQIASDNSLKCIVSLEQRMGCGIGACLACACKVRAADGKGSWIYKRVCKDGPCFDADEVIFDD